MPARPDAPTGVSRSARAALSLILALGVLGVFAGSASAVNTAPTAVSDSGNTDEDVQLVVPAPGVLNNDSDPDSDPLTAVLVDEPSHGTVALDPDGSYTYTPDPDFNGSDSFTYKANDGTLDSNTATVDITVNPVADAPVATPDSTSTNEDTQLDVTAPGVLGNDSDADGDALTAVLETDVSHGTLTLHADGSYSYVPAANFHGSDSFTYKANDGSQDSNVVTVSITVNSVNDAPVAAPDTAPATDEDTPLTVAAPGVLGNDTDVDGDPITAVKVTDPSHGTVSLNGDGSYTYTPAPNYNGSDSFTYKANDSHTDSNTVTVSLTVNAVPDAPVATPDSASTNEDTQLDVAAPGVLGNDSDADGDSLTAVKQSDPTHGALTFRADGSYTYVPTANYHGPDSFTYKANDGTADSNIVTVSITVNSVNDAPTADGETATTDEDTPVNIDVLTGDADVDGDTLTPTGASDPPHGSVTLNSDKTYTYTPDSNYNGPDSFTYKASDGTAESAPATVTITVNAVNDAPVANNDNESVAAGHTLNSNVLNNDTDVDNPHGALTASLVSNVSHGTLAFNDDGSYSYDPDAGYTGPDSFTYKANDGALDSNTATVQITVNSTNGSPNANNDEGSTNEDTPLSVPAPGVLANDTDPNGDTLTAAKTSDPLHGTATVQGNGAYTYTPDPDFNGVDSFSYTASDGTPGHNATANVTITVNPVDDPPVANNDDRTIDEDTPTVLNVRSNDEDVDGDAITVTAASNPDHGTTELSGGDVRYTPNANYCNEGGSPDTFTYSVNGGDTATVSVNVRCVDDAPSAANDARTVAQGAPATAVDVLANDPDPDGGPKQVTSATQAGRGTTTVTGSGVTYKPDPTYCNSQPGGTPDTFTYTLNGGSQATVSMTVTCGAPLGPGEGPTFASARLTNTTFAVDPKGTAETAVTARAKKGTTFVYGLSEDARVLFTIEQVTKGRKVGSKCVKPTKSNRKKRSCTRYVKIGSFAQDGVQGTNSKAFSGKIGRRTLKPGKYRATLVATDASGNASKAKRLSMKVVKR